MAETIGNEDQRPPRGERTPKAKPKAKPATSKSEPKGDSSGTSTGTKKRVGQDRKVLESLIGTYQMAGGVFTSAGMVRQDQGLANTGLVIIDRAELLAESWMELADQNPRVKQALKSFTEGSAAAALIALHVTCVMPLLIDRGVVPQTVAPFVMPTTAQQPSTNGNGN